MDTHRTLVIMRHAKAEASAPSDFERRLAPRGIADAKAAGRWLAETGIVADSALVSAAHRTRDTWESVADGAEWDVTPDFDEGLYAAGPDTALDLVRALPAARRTAIVIGHNPTMAYLAQLLDDGSGDAGATDQLLGGAFPTSALAVFAVPGAWAAVVDGGCRLVGYHVGRG